MDITPPKIGHWHIPRGGWGVMAGLYAQHVLSDKAVKSHDRGKIEFADQIQ